MKITVPAQSLYFWISVLVACIGLWMFVTPWYDAVVEWLNSSFVGLKGWQISVIGFIIVILSARYGKWRPV